jgi:Amino acid permease
VAPDCGTSFTWTTKAFGPYVGWLGGWTAVLATVIVLSNLAGVAVQFFYQFFGDLLNNPDLGALWENKLVNVLTCLAFLAVATWVAYRGITTTEKVQFVLVGFQLVLLLIFALVALVKAGDSETGLGFSLDWFSPSGLTLSAFVAGLSGSIFAFWGWDTSLTVNEESKESEKIPGRAALLCVVSILLTYLLVAVATQMYAGVGTEGLGLGNETISDNVFGALAEPVLGSPLDLFLFLAVIASSAASLITTFLPSSRTMLAMGTYRAFPQRFATVHPRYLTPSYATIAAGIGVGLFYAVLTFASENSLGIMICFYYGLTASRASGTSATSSSTTRRASSSSCCSHCSVVSGCRDPAYFRGETLQRDTPNRPLPPFGSAGPTSSCEHFGIPIHRSRPCCPHRRVQTCWCSVPGDSRASEDCSWAPPPCRSCSGTTHRNRPMLPPFSPSATPARSVAAWSPSPSTRLEVRAGSRTSTPRWHRSGRRRPDTGRRCASSPRSSLTSRCGSGTAAVDPPESSSPSRTAVDWRSSAPADWAGSSAC